MLNKTPVYRFDTRFHARFPSQNCRQFDTLAIDFSDAYCLPSYFSVDTLYILHICRDRRITCNAYHRPNIQLLYLCTPAVTVYMRACVVRLSVLLCRRPYPYVCLCAYICLFDRVFLEAVDRPAFVSRRFLCRASSTSPINNFDADFCAHAVCNVRPSTPLACHYKRSCFTDKSNILQLFPITTTTSCGQCSIGGGVQALV